MALMEEETELEREEDTQDFGGGIAESRAQRIRKAPVCFVSNKARQGEHYVPDGKWSSQCDSEGAGDQFTGESSGVSSPSEGEGDLALDPDYWEENNPKLLPPGAIIGVAHTPRQWLRAKVIKDNGPAGSIDVVIVNAPWLRYKVSRYGDNGQSEICPASDSIVRLAPPTETAPVTNSRKSCATC